MKTYPLLNTQLGIFFHCLKHSGSTQYNLPSLIELADNTDLEQLDRALHVIVESCQALRLRFMIDSNGVPQQYVDDEMSITIKRISMSERALRSYISSDAVQPFDLISGEPLFRFSIIITEKSRYLLVDIHHIVCDGYSYGKILLGQYLPLAYDGKPLPKSSYEMWHAAEEESSASHGNDYYNIKELYRNKFANHDFLSLGQTATNPSGRQICRSSSVTKQLVDEWCKNNGLSPNLLFMAAFSLVVSRISRVQQVCYHTMVHGRNEHRLRHSFGMYVKTLPVLLSVNNDMSLQEFFECVKTEFNSAVRNSCYPFSDLCVDLGMEPKIYYNFLGADNLEKLQLGGENMSGGQLLRPCVEDDLGVEIYSKDTDYEIRCVSSEALNSEDRIAKIASCMHVVVMQMISSRDMSLGMLSLVDDTETVKIVDMSHGKTMNACPAETFPSLFIKQALATPSSVAVVDRSGRFTYNELNRHSSYIATKLIDLGITESMNVCVMLDYQREFLAAALGVERAGACYVPINCETPFQRLRYMIADSAFLITSHQTYENIEDVLSHENVVVLFIEDLIQDSLECEKQDLCIDKSSLDGIAYMIYTSGSTGFPKGVRISHKAKAHLIMFVVKEWKIDASSRISCHSNFSFDASVEDLFPALTVGGIVYIVPQDIRNDINLLHDYIVDNKITGGCYSTQFAQLLINKYPSLPLDYIVVGGEKMSYVPKCTPRLINTYGPTEFTVDATYVELSDEHDYTNIPIGRPLDDLIAFVLDESDHVVPNGFVGELCLSGIQMAEGYYKQPQLTEKQFCVVNISGNSYKIYHTGDLARYNNDGLLEFVGRMDKQVKIRGVRIELEEIESIIASYPHIISQTAQVTETSSNKYISVYYVADRNINVNDLKAYTQQFLPSCMLPSVYMQVQSLPLTSNGKINVESLPMPEFIRCDEYEEPQNLTEKIFVEIFSNILEVDRVGVNDDFFSMGGTSLNAINVVVEAEKYGFNIVYRDVFLYKTPRLLASSITSHASSALDTPEDYSIYNEMLRKNSIEKCKNAIDSPCSAYLIAGVTGFLGIHLLKELLDNTDAHIYCLLRKKNSKSTCERLDSSFKFYFDKDIDLSKRVTAIECDVLSPHDIELLKDILPRSLTVFNCVGNVKHFSANDDIMNINTMSVRNLIRLCLCTDSRLIHVSSESVAGITSSTESNTEQVLTEHDFWLGQDVRYNQYVYSKFLAEKLVLDSIRNDGLLAKIMRVGNLSPRMSDGKFQVNESENYLYSIVKAIILLGAAPKYMLTNMFDISPVDETAHALSLLSATPNDCLLFHPFNNEKLTLSDIIHWLNKSGTKIEYMDIEPFHERLSNAMQDADMAILLRPLIAYDLGSDKQFYRNKCDNRLTTDILSHMNFTWNKINYDYFLKALKNLPL